MELSEDIVMNFTLRFRPFKFRLGIDIGDWSFGVKGTKGNPDWSTRYRHEVSNSIEWSMPVSRGHRIRMHRWIRSGRG